MSVRRCPTCRQPVDWDQSEFRPFCSERCQMIDLGRWASEDYRVPLVESSDGLITDFDREPVSQSFDISPDDEHKAIRH